MLYKKRLIWGCVSIRCSQPALACFCLIYDIVTYSWGEISSVANRPCFKTVTLSSVDRTFHTQQLLCCILLSLEKYNLYCTSYRVLQQTATPRALMTTQNKVYIPKHMVSVLYEHCLQGALSHFVVSTIIIVLLQGLYNIKHLQEAVAVIRSCINKTEQKWEVNCVNSVWS